MRLRRGDAARVREGAPADARAWRVAHLRISARLSLSCSKGRLAQARSRQHYLYKEAREELLSGGRSMVATGAPAAHKAQLDGMARHRTRITAWTSSLDR